MTSATVFAAVLAVLFASHVWADHCWQTDKWAAAEGRPDPEVDGPTAAESWRALLAHVAVYHLVMAVMLAVTAALLDLPISWAGAAAGIAFSAVTHGFWGRRWPVKAWMVLAGFVGCAGFFSRAVLERTRRPAAPPLLESPGS
jgi:hypothetical protein